MIFASSKTFPVVSLVLLRQGCLTYPRLAQDKLELLVLLNAGLTSFYYCFWVDFHILAISHFYLSKENTFGINSPEE